jgi:hypothetical protein
LKRARRARAVIAVVAFFSCAGEDGQLSGGVDSQDSFATGHLDDVGVAYTIKIDTEGIVDTTICRRAGGFSSAACDEHEFFGVNRREQEECEQRRLELRFHINLMAVLLQ